MSDEKVEQLLREARRKIEVDEELKERLRGRLMKKKSVGKKLFGMVLNRIFGYIKVTQ